MSRRARSGREALFIRTSSFPATCTPLESNDGHRTVSSAMDHRMTHSMMRCIILALSCCTLNCRDAVSPPSDPPVPPPDKSVWQVVPEFENYDIRYIIEFKDELYCAVMIVPSSAEARSAVVKTSDGETWTTVRRFSEAIGPMAVNGDSLYVLTDHFVHRMDAQGEWVQRFGVPWQISDAQLNGDMAFLNGNLYIAQTRMTGYLFMVTPDSIWTQLFPYGFEISPSIARIVPFRNGNSDAAYCRSIFSSNSVISIFDGKTLTDISTKPSKDAFGNNAITMYNNTLYAGYHDRVNNKSGAVYQLTNDMKWLLYHDSLPNAPFANDYDTPMVTHPISILFLDNRMIVGTESYGVFIVNDTLGWISLNSGLKMHPVKTANGQLYEAIVFLNAYKKYLFAAYGYPAFSWGLISSTTRFGLRRTVLVD